MKKIHLIGCLVFLTGMLSQAYADTVFYAEDSGDIDVRDTNAKRPKYVEKIYCDPNGSLTFADSERNILVSTKNFRGSCEDVANSLNRAGGKSPILISKSSFPMMGYDVRYLKKIEKARTGKGIPYEVDESKDSVGLSKYAQLNASESIPKTVRAGGKKAAPQATIEEPNSGETFRDSGAYNKGMEILEGGSNTK